MLLCCLVYELQFPHKFDSEKAVENTELLEVYSSLKQNLIRTLLAKFSKIIILDSILIFAIHLSSLCLIFPSKFQVIQLGTCWMLLVLEECVHHRKTRVSKHNLYYAVNIWTCWLLVHLPSPIVACMFEVRMLLAGGMNQQFSWSW